jgi:hypothetical protein
MKLSICCRTCGTEHKLTKQNFPITLTEKREIDLDEEQKTEVEVVIGHICRRCSLKAGLRRLKEQVKVRDKTLTKKDMYNEKGECILPKGKLEKKYVRRSKYPKEETKNDGIANG